MVLIHGWHELETVGRDVRDVRRLCSWQCSYEEESSVLQLAESKRDGRDGIAGISEASLCILRGVLGACSEANVPREGFPSWSMTFDFWAVVETNHHGRLLRRTMEPHSGGRGVVERLNGSHSHGKVEQGRLTSDASGGVEGYIQIAYSRQGRNASRCYSMCCTIVCVPRRSPPD